VSGDIATLANVQAMKTTFINNWCAIKRAVLVLIGDYGDLLSTSTLKVL